MKPTDDPDLIAKVEHETWERCAKGYADGFGTLVSESITPLLDAACVMADSRGLGTAVSGHLGFEAILARGAGATSHGFRGVSGRR